jgi:hypothetical protein
MEQNHNIKNLPILNRLPSKNDGRDGNTYIVRDRGQVYIYHKREGEWYRTQMEKL